MHSEEKSMYRLVNAINNNKLPDYVENKGATENSLRVAEQILAPIQRHGVNK